MIPDKNKIKQYAEMGILEEFINKCSISVEDLVLSLCMGYDGEIESLEKEINKLEHDNEFQDSQLDWYQDKGETGE